MQAAAYEPVQSWDAGTNLSAMTVDFMLEVVTHSGVNKTEGTLVPVLESSVLPLTRVDGAFWPARR